MKIQIEITESDYEELKKRGENIDEAISNLLKSSKYLETLPARQSVLGFFDDEDDYEDEPELVSNGISNNVKQAS